MPQWLSWVKSNENEILTILDNLGKKAAETGGGLMLAIFAYFGIPASTTHAITGSIMGAGSAKRKRAVRWKVGKQIVYAWVITIPGAAAFGIGFTYLIELFV